MNRIEQPRTLAQPSEPASTGKVTAHSSSPRPVNKVSATSPRSSNGHAQSVKLHIEQLVLHGFDASNRYRIGESFEREMARLFTQRGVNSGIRMPVELARLDGIQLQLEPNCKSEVIGTQLARAIYRGLNR
jgi:hypothetical protein